MADILNQIAKLKENDLRRKIIVPLLRGLNMLKVEEWHGSNEEGKDLYFCYLDPFGDRKHCCCFIKAAKITKSGKTDIRKMEGQLKEAIATPFVDPFDSKNKVKTEELYIVCNGQINKEAKEYIHNMVYSHAMPNVRIIDIDKLINIISASIIIPYNKMLGGIWIFNIDEFENVCNAVSSSK